MSGLLCFLYQSEFYNHRNHTLAPPSPVQCPAHCEGPVNCANGLNDNTKYLSSYLPPLRWDSHFSLGNLQRSHLITNGGHFNFLPPTSKHAWGTISCANLRTPFKIIEFTSSSAWIGCKWTKIDSRWKLNRFQNNYILVTLFSLIGALAQWTSASGISAGVTGRHICLGANLHICSFAKNVK